MPSDSSRRRLLRLTGAAATLSLAGCASVTEQFADGGGPSGGDGTDVPTEAASGSETTADDVSTPDDGSPDDSGGDSWSTESVTIDDPDVSLSNVPLPDENTRYARMGEADADAVATVFGNWKCPYTQEFVLNQLPQVVDDFVRSGDLQVEFRALAYLSGEPFLGADAPRSARAGLAVWDVDRESYWSYFAYVFTNQPQERYEWGQPSLLRRFAEESGVNQPGQIGDVADSDAFSNTVRETTGAADDAGISTVPRIVTDDRVTAPTVDFEETLSQLEQATGL
ncbi:DsbA family protein [Halorarum salinum]|uniref:Thioredoxin domain-containing protein n=1 Tax=Halorarum salinum TaxID=2743089 RepID=A0A7D5Q932_9EURY|nr:thioredoxin domain-containing protein [Halobaculum salinum]QLG60399.1 thioredoxin domain-containing protein [Halobaculum salinum]